MPRLGWMAVGATVIALIGTEQALGPRGRLALLGLVAIASAAVLLASRHSRARVPLLAILAGALLVALRLGPTIAREAPVLPPLPTDAGPWDADVTSIASPRDGLQRAVLRLLAPGSPLVAASLPHDPGVVPGDRVTVHGTVRPPPVGDYGDYLERSGISGTLLGRRIELLGPTVVGADPTRDLESVRRAVDRGLAHVLPEPQAGLASGILVGLRDRVDRELAAAFTVAGASHVVAISGWNIAIVAACIAALLRRRTGRRARSLVTLLAIAGYTAFAGASPSVVRAAVMAAVVLIARESGRGGRALEALGGAVVLLLAVEPSLARDVGLQLSALATAGLIVWGTSLTERLARLWGGRLPGWLAESLGVSLAAQASTLPLVLLTFGRLSLIAPFANIAIVPIVPLAMAAGALAAVAGVGATLGLPGIVATVVALPAWLTLGAIIAIVRVAAAVPFASVDVDGQIALFALSTLAGAALLVRAWLRHSGASRRRTAAPGEARGAGGSPVTGPSSRKRRRGRRLALIAAAVGLAGVLIAAAARPSGTPAVVVLDVGQGDAILVEGGEGGRLLVDAGGDPERLIVRLDERIPPWDRRIDIVVATHPHEDHIAGLPLLLERYRVGRVLATARRGTGPTAAVLDGALARAGRSLESVGPGTTLHVDAVELVALWPPAARVADPGTDGRTVNDTSVILLGRVGSRSFLLLGDAEEDVDPQLLALGLPRVDLLKVAHHGSATATSGPLLDRLRPSIAAISVGARNRYGHPARSTLARLEAVGARLFRTDRVGTIEVRLEAGGLEVRTAHREDVPVPQARPSAAAVASRRAARAGVGLYHRPDVSPRASRRRRPPALARSAALVPAALAGRGRDRRVARARCAARGPIRGPPTRRGRGPPPRRGQARGGPVGCDGRGPAPRRGLRSVACGARSRRARAGGRRAPGRAARR